MSGITATRTVDEIFKEVTRQFGDESGVQITQDDVFRWVNSGQDEILRRQKPIKAIATADLVGGQTTYTFPNNILEVQALHVSGVKLDYRSFQEAEEYILNQDTTILAGVPTMWYEWGGNFILWPKPTSTITDGITIYYIPAVARVRALTDVLSIPDSFYNRLLEYVMAQAYELDENWDGVNNKTNQFEKNMQDYDKRSSVHYDTYPMITVLDEDSW